MVIDEDDLDSIAFEGYYSWEDSSAYSPFMTSTAYMMLFKDMELVDKLKQEMEKSIIHWKHQRTTNRRDDDTRIKSVKETIIDAYTSKIEGLDVTVTRLLPNILDAHGDFVDQHDPYYNLDVTENGRKYSIADHLIGFDLPAFFRQVEESYSKTKPTFP